MKNKSISKFLQEKSMEFIKNFPSDLGDKIINDAFITGGSLLNLKEYTGGEMIDNNINDFDIYFKSKTTLLSVVKELILSYHNEKKNENYYDKCIKGVSIIFKDTLGNKYSESDYYSDDSGKIFLSLDLPKAFNAISHHDYFRHLIKEREGISFITKHSISIGKYQIIMRFVGDPEYIHNFFDFEHAKGVYDFKTGDVYYSEKTINSIIDKELKYDGTKYPLKSILRVIKFVKRGWSINSVEVLKMIFQLQRLDLTNLAILEDQLTGVYGDNISSFFDNIKDSGFESNIYDDLIFTLEKDVNQLRYPAYNDSPSIIDFLNNY